MTSTKAASSGFKIGGAAGTGVILLTVMGWLYSSISDLRESVSHLREGQATITASRFTSDDALPLWHAVSDLRQSVASNTTVLSRLDEFEKQLVAVREGIARLSGGK